MHVVRAGVAMHSSWESLHHLAARRLQEIAMQYLLVMPAPIELKRT